MYAYYRERYRRHALNWVTPFARGYIHGMVLGGVLTLVAVFAAKYLL